MNRLILIAGLVLLSSTFFPVHGQFVADGRFYVTSGEESLCVPLVSNRPIDVPQPNVDRVVIVLPGGSRNVVQMWEEYRVAAFQAEVLESTMLVGMQFLIESDIEFYDLENDVAYWTHTGWHMGELSDSTTANQRPFSLSSYTFMDSLIYQIATVNPHVEAIVVSGPSAGAKYTQRYAAANRVESLLGQQNGPPMIHVPIANGSFIYLSEHRRRVDGEFATPDQVMQGFIPQYNRFPYGLSELNEYCQETGEDYISSSYGEKYVFYIIGAIDNGPNSDNQPMAMQGWNNIQRNVFFYEHILSHYGPEANHSLILIPGVAHEADLILQNTLSWEPLFFFVPD
jgi:hypothetical protein